MSNPNIQWYSINLKSKVEDHEAVGLDEAIRIVDRYLSHAGEKYKNGEEGLAASMFGFSRSKSEFIEFGVIGPARTFYKFEVTDPEVHWLRKLFFGVFQHNEELHSGEEVIQKVEEYFTTPVHEIKRRFQNR